MEAKARPIGKLLEERTRFTVPIFQRHYEWERKEQWEPLWNDIQDKADEVLQGTVRNYAHYMGALILSEGKARLGEVPVKQVIDGQQRLATFQLFLNALKRVAVERGLTKLSEVIETNLTNDKPQLMEQPEIEKYKLWPTRYDRTLYADVVDSSFAILSGSMVLRLVFSFNGLRILFVGSTESRHRNRRSCAEQTAELSAEQTAG